MDIDRTVHAIAGTCEIVRYDCHSTWWVEDTNSHYRKHVGVDEAVALVVRAIEDDKGEVFLGEPGGGLFDRLYRAATGEGAS